MIGQQQLHELHCCGTNENVDAIAIVTLDVEFPDFTKCSISSFEKAANSNKLRQFMKLGVVC